jgi:hypothetical protein
MTELVFELRSRESEMALNAPCKTPEDACMLAAKAVEACDEVLAKFQQIQAEIDAIKVSLGGGRVLATAYVRNGMLNGKLSSPNVKFQAPGVLTFPNPRNLRIVPLLSVVAEYAAGYTTSDAYILKDPTSTSVEIRQGAKDTGNRVFPPHDFTAVILGFDDDFK